MKEGGFSRSLRRVVATGAFPLALDSVAGGPQDEQSRTHVGQPGPLATAAEVTARGRPALRGAFPRSSGDLQVARRPRGPPEPRAVPGPPLPGTAVCSPGRTPAPQAVRDPASSGRFAV